MEFWYNRAMEIISKKEAINKGLIKYYSGKPCKNGHLSERRVNRGKCLGCEKMFYESDGRKESLFKYNNSEPRKAHLREWVKSGKAREDKRKARGFPEPTREMPDVCEICGKPETATHKSGTVISLSLDHCHETNKFRGWLCGKCNKALGMVQDNIDTLGKMIEYLKERAG